jgi:hypothetical protein
VRRFCTYFDSNYLFKGLALHRSLARHAPGSELWVLCLDERVQLALQRLALPGLRVLPLAALEAAEPRLLEAKRDRSAVEYYFTCTPALVSHLMTREAPGEPVTYLDADLLFFASPEPLFEESRGSSVTIVGHRFPPKLHHLERFGRYNVSWITFGADAAGRECLCWWRDRCLEWCFDRLEDGKFADQKYLDDWPTRFQGVHVLAHEGAGVAPWNVAAHPIALRDGRLFAGGAPLIFYHFHGFKRLAPWLFDPGLASYDTTLAPELRSGVYLPYVAALRDGERRLLGAIPGFAGGWGAPRGLGYGALVRRALRRQLLIAP